MSFVPGGLPFLLSSVSHRLEIFPGTGSVYVGMVAGLTPHLPNSHA